MALLEDGNACCICGAPVRHIIGGMPAYYCVTCYEPHKDAILGNAPWVKFLMNGERQRRKRRNRLLVQGYCLTPVYVTGGRYAERFPTWFAEGRTERVQNLHSPRPKRDRGDDFERG